LGGFIGVDEEREKWIAAKITTWKDSIQQLASVAGAYPQSAYVGMQKPVQAKWTFVQRVVRDVGDKFSVIRDAM
jgi:hypothetical protein